MEVKIWSEFEETEYGNKQGDFWV